MTIVKVRQHNLGEKYQAFQADPFWNITYNRLMHEVIQAGLAPANVADVMRLVIEVFNGSDSAQKNFLPCYYLGTADGVAYPSGTSEFSGRFKLNTNSEWLEHDAKSKIPIPNAVYVAIQGPEFVRVKVDNQEFALLAYKFTPTKAYRKEELYELGATSIARSLGVVKIGGKEVDEIENSDLWLALAHYDFRKSPTDASNQVARELRDDYRKAIFAILKQRGYDKGMGVFLSSEEATPTIQPWFIGLLPWIFDGSARGSEVHSDWAYLIGMQTENIKATRKLESIVLT